MTDASPLMPWRVGRLLDKADQTPRGADLVFAIDGWRGHRAGQHVDLRLTGADGYQAQRSYSIASPPQPGILTLTVERLENGEVSPYLADEMRVGDGAEIRGPIGEWFVWSPGDTHPLLLIGGGFGIVPLMSMLRHRSALGRCGQARLIVSARSQGALPYEDELERLARSDPTLGVRRVLTQPQTWEQEGSRRLTRERLAELAYPTSVRPSVFVCGPTGFVETVAGALVELGHEPAAIRTERFGATGTQTRLLAA